MGKFILGDCMHPEYGLPSYPDKYFDLAIVDPPYGIEAKISVGGGSHTKNRCNFHQYYKENGKTWDKRPDESYFNQLFRVSKKAIVWGANYFQLPPSSGIICWDKDRAVQNFSQWEMAWTNMDFPARIYKFCNNGGFVLSPKNRFKTHPTQKPVELYEVLLSDFAKPGNLILDTHVGSASSLIACESMGFDYIGFEIDPDYYAAAQNRMSKGIQGVLL